MDDCCQEKEAELAAMQATHGRVLRIVLAINAVFFLIEFTAGILANSTALLADSLDMLGDAFVYGLSLFVLSRSVKWKAGASESPKHRRTQSDPGEARRTGLSRKADWWDS